MIYCTCGHSKDDHIERFKYCGSCSMLYSIGGPTGPNHIFHTFKQDNLKYLEELYNERI